MVFGVVGFAIFLTGAFMAWAILRQLGGGLPLVYASVLLAGFVPMDSGRASHRCAHCASELLVPCDLAGSLLGARRDATQRARAARESDLAGAVRAGGGLVALLAMGRATRGPMRQRAAVDATIAGVTKRAREALGDGRLLG